MATAPQNAVARHLSRSLRPYARLLTKNAEKAENLLQEVFSKAPDSEMLPESVERIDGRIITWWRKVLRNTFITECRKKKTERDHRAAAVEYYETRSKAPTDPRIIAQAHEREERLLEAIEKLPKPPQQLWAKARQKGLSVRQAAAALGLAEGAAGNLQRATMAALRKLLPEASDLFDD